MIFRDLRAFRAIAILAVALILSACRTSGSSAAGLATVPIDLPDIEGYGLAVRHHDTRQPLERIHEVIDSLPGERLTDEAWAAYGLEVIRLRESDLSGLWGPLPASSPPGLVWHGQAITWRNILPPAVPVGEREMVTGNQVEAFPGGVVGLAGRGWSLMTLDGPRVLVELAPRLEVRGVCPDRFDALRREFNIGPGDVLLLVAGSGRWPHPPPEDTSVEGLEAAKKVGTMGQLLLEVDSEEEASQRLVMLTPRFGEWEQRLRGSSSPDQDSHGR